MDLEAESSLIENSSFTKSKQANKIKKTRLNRSQTFAKSRSKVKPVQAKPVELYHVETKPIVNQRSAEQQAYTKYSSKSAFNLKDDLPKAGHSSPTIKSERLRERSNLMKDPSSTSKAPPHNPNLIVSGFTSSSGVTKKLAIPLTSKKKYLPELRTRLSLEDLKSLEKAENDKAGVYYSYIFIFMIFY